MSLSLALNYWAAHAGHVDVARMLVVDFSATVDNASKYGRTPLHFAASRGHLAVARMLVVDGHANVDIADKYGKTPLHMAAILDHLDFARMLVVDGHANVDIADKDGETALYTAAHRGDLAFACMLVVDGRANVNTADKKGDTPLHVAARRGQHDVAHFLLDKGAKPDKGNKMGVAPIDLAAKSTKIRPPDMDLLCRMIGGSGALIVLATKMVRAHLERSEKRRAAASNADGPLVSKRRCLDANPCPEGSG